MNSYSIKNAIREELSQQVRSAINEDTIIEAIHDAIHNMELDDMIQDAISGCVAENVELVISDMVQECIDDVVEDEICNIFENLQGEKIMEKKITMEFTKEELAFLQWAMIVTKVEAESDLESGIGREMTK